MESVLETLRVMVQKARDSAALHAAHGEREEAKRWTELADRWEERVAKLSAS